MDPTQPPVVMMALPLHAPVVPGPLPVKKSGWPTAIGVITVVLGSLGALSGIWSIVGQFLMSALSQIPGQKETIALLTHWRPWLIAIAAATIIVAILLLFGGITLMRRRAFSRSLILVWAALKIVLVIVSSVITYQLNEAQFAVMQQSGMNMSGMQGVMNIAGIASVIVSLVWGMALPVFMIIWFMRPRVMREMNQWP